MMAANNTQRQYEPRIVAFLCNWCAYAGADLAGTQRLSYPPNVRVIRLMCTGRVDPGFIVEALLDVARQTNTPLVDVRLAIERLSQDGIPDDEHLLDHVHPTIEAHKRIAGWIVAWLIESEVVVPVETWQATRDRLYREHFEALDDLYFVQGMQRLAALRAWTQGKADGQFGKTPATQE